MHYDPIPQCPTTISPPWSKRSALEESRPPPPTTTSSPGKADAVELKKKRRSLFMQRRYYSSRKSTSYSSIQTGPPLNRHQKRSHQHQHQQGKQATITITITHPKNTKKVGYRSLPPSGTPDSGDDDNWAGPPPWVHEPKMKTKKICVSLCVPKAAGRNVTGRQLASLSVPSVTLDIIINHHDHQSPVNHPAQAP